MSRIDWDFLETHEYDLPHSVELNPGEIALTELLLVHAQNRFNWIFTDDIDWDIISGMVDALLDKVIDR